MKKLFLLGLFATVVLPHYQPMFDNMIVRCDDQGKCHWECEFGVATSTTMVNDNLIVKASACNPKTEPPKTSNIQIQNEQLFHLTTEYNGL